MDTWILSEHKQAVQREDPKNGIVVHVQKINHGINSGEATMRRK